MARTFFFQYLLIKFSASVVKPYGTFVSIDLFPSLRKQTTCVGFDQNALSRSCSLDKLEARKAKQKNRRIQLFISRFGSSCTAGTDAMRVIHNGWESMERIRCAMRRSGSRLSESPPARAPRSTIRTGTQPYRTRRGCATRKA